MTQEVPLETLRGRLRVPFQSLSRPYSGVCTLLMSHELVNPPATLHKFVATAAHCHSWFAPSGVSGFGEGVSKRPCELDWCSPWLPWLPGLLTDLTTWSFPLLLFRIGDQPQCLSWSPWASPRMCRSELKEGLA